MVLIVFLISAVVDQRSKIISGFANVTQVLNCNIYYNGDSIIFSIFSYICKNISNLNLINHLVLRLVIFLIHNRR